MSTLGELLRETPQSAEQSAEQRPEQRPEHRPEGTAKRRFFTRLEAAAVVKQPAAPSERDEQIEILIQNLFLRPQTKTVRRVAFAPVEASGRAARLCLDMARALAGKGPHEVGLIDATVDEVPLPQLLQIPAPAGACAPWAIAQRLWLAPRELGVQQPSIPPISKTCRSFANSRQIRFFHRSLSGHLMVSARIGQACDGLVLVLTAGQTRQLRGRAS